MAKRTINHPTKKNEFKTKTPKEIFEIEVKEQFDDLLNDTCLVFEENRSPDENLKWELENYFKIFVLSVASVAEEEGFCSPTENKSQRRGSEVYVKTLLKKMSLEFMVEKMDEQNNSKNFAFTASKTFDFANKNIDKVFDEENKRLRRTIEKQILESKKDKVKTKETPFYPQLRGKF